MRLKKKLGRPRDLNEYKFDFDKKICYMKLDKGYVCSISIEDYEKVKDYTWRAELHHNIPCHVTSVCGGHRTMLHRLIMNVLDYDWRKVQVDHKDRNALNNTRDNLRICTNSQNQINKGLSKNNTNGIKRTCDRGFGVYEVCVSRGDKKEIVFVIGYENAKKKREELEVKFYGQFSPCYVGDAKLNDINPGDTKDVINAKFGCWQYEGKSDDELTTILQEANDKYDLGFNDCIVKNKKITKREV